MPIIDIILLVLACLAVLGLVWASEQVQNWFWSRVFRLLGFLLQTTLGLVVSLLVVAVLGYFAYDWYMTPIPTAAVEGQAVAETSTNWLLWIAVSLGVASLAYSALRYARRTNQIEQPEPQPVFEPYEAEEESEPFPWKSLLVFETLFAPSLTSLMMWVLHTVAKPTEQFSGLSSMEYSVFSVVSFLISLLLGFLVWIPAHGAFVRRQERLAVEAEQRAAEARREEQRLRSLAADPPAEDEPERTEGFDLRIITGSPSRPEPSHPVRPDPADGGPTLNPAPGTRRMPPPTFGRPPARPAEEPDMDIHEPTPPRGLRGRRDREPVEDTGPDRRQADGRQGWPWYVWAGGAVLIVVLIGVAVWLWPKSEPSEQTVLMERAAKMQAEVTLRTVMKTDPVLSKNCPQGWNDDCWRTLSEAKIELPPCVKLGQSQVSPGVGWSLEMDDRCRAEMIGQNRQRVEEAAARPSGEVEKYLFGTEFSQRQAFEAGNTAKINLLLDDPALKREVILDFWTKDYVPWRILSHPSLTKGDLTAIYGQVQANGWYEAMPWLTINPNLDPDLRGMWMTRPVADPVERERQILLGMHQPEVPVALYSWIVQQAVDEFVEGGSLDLWNTLLKAGENGDLVVNKCHVEGEADKDRKKYPPCVEGKLWDTVGQMEQAQAKHTGLPSPAIGWTDLRYRCSFESFVGRHSPVAASRATKLVPQMEDVSPSNLPPRPE